MRTLVRKDLLAATMVIGSLMMSMDDAEASDRRRITVSPGDIGTQKRIGLGISLGHPSGFTGKFFLGGPVHALDVGVGWSVWGRRYNHLFAHVTYLWHPFLIAEAPELLLDWHVGVGAYFDFWDRDGGVGVRVPIGLDLNLRKVPIGFFLDVSANVGIVPDTYAWPGAALGARFFF